MKKYYLPAFLILPGLLNAHPGHDYFNGYSIQHYLSSPIHLFSILAGVAACILIIRFAGKTSKIYS